MTYIDTCLFSVFLVASIEMVAAYYWIKYKKDWVRNRARRRMLKNCPCCGADLFFSNAKNCESCGMPLTINLSEMHHFARYRPSY